MLYLKVNPTVVRHFDLEAQRTQLPDGNFLLWQGDAALIDPRASLYEVAEAVGGVVLTHLLASMEQLGQSRVFLPEPKDQRFIFVAPAETEADTEAEAEVEAEAAP